MKKVLCTIVALAAFAANARNGRLVGLFYFLWLGEHGTIYDSNAKLVVRVLQEYHDAGWNIPKVMLYTNTASGQTVRRIYDAIYKPGFSKDTWFALDGRPVIVASSASASSSSTRQ